MSKPPPVSFLVAGVQKGGTTAIHDYLRTHPDLCLPSSKEVHFFDDETAVDWSAPDYAAYHSVFLAERPRPRALWGEATPIYIYWPRALERISAYNAAMKLIVLLRDPVERAWSHWKMERGRGVEPLSFSESIREGRQRVAQATDASGAHRVHSYVERGFYGAQIERLFGIFPREQVLLLRSDHLKREPARILGNASDFLQIPHLPKVELLESHVGRKDDASQKLSVEDREYLRSVYSQDQQLLLRLTGIDLFH